ncbi:MAG: beta-ketoacyl synthase N-terminal-like domain-containing protein [Planctomycetota bacterium]|nr:beta-ketoacyl synthase N-terminal-like domain-containing protein [Planctomycetota bacterium]
MTDKIQRVVITGVGAVSPMGVGTKALYEGIAELRSTATMITKFNTDNHRVKFACTVPDFELHPDIDPREARRMDPFAQFGMTAAVEAVKDSDLHDNADPDRVGVLLGTGIGGILELEIQLRRMYEKGPRRVSPLLIPKMILDIVPGLIAMRYGFRNVNFGIASACASASHAMGEAFRHVKHGYADAVVTGGCEAGIVECSLAGFSNMGALSTRNDDPENASRPFDKNRDGFVMGEGAGVMADRIPRAREETWSEHPCGDRRIRRFLRRSSYYRTRSRREGREASHGDGARGSRSIAGRC